MSTAVSAQLCVTLPTVTLSVLSWVNSLLSLLCNEDRTLQTDPDELKLYF